MGELFDKILKSDESIFLNPQFLDSDYQPKLVKFRESQQSYIATCIKPLLQRRNGKNLVIFGKPGVGKTVCLKNVLNELKEDYSSEVSCLYVNCWKRDTSFKIINDICEQINYKWTHNKNFDELMEAVSEIINEKSVVIVLDEADKLQDEDVIYSFLEEFHRKCIILITNDQTLTIKLDDRIKSRLLPDNLEFKPYNYKETEEILRQRVEYAFVPKTLNEDAFLAVAKKTFELEDMRAGLFLLKQSGENAENKSSRTINLEHVNEAINSLVSINFQDDSNSENLLSIIKENSGKSMTEVFKVYEQKEGKSYRTFQRKVNELKKQNKITTKEEPSDFGKQTMLQYFENK